MQTNDSSFQSIKAAMTDHHTIEARHEEKVCHIKINEEHYFAVEAKVGPNDWRLIEEVYPQIEQASAFFEWDEAKLIKNRLKRLLLGPFKNQCKKRPIRIRKIF